MMASDTAETNLTEIGSASVFFLFSSVIVTIAESVELIAYGEDRLGPS